MLSHRLIGLSCSLLAACGLQGVERQFIGPRATAIGGVGIASNADSNAIWQPGSFGHVGMMPRSAPTGSGG